MEETALHPSQSSLRLKPYLLIRLLSYKMCMISIRSTMISGILRLC